MKKAERVAAGTLRPEYKRSDFGALARGKYAARLQTNSNVFVLDPEVAEVFPNGDAVNAALRSLVEIAKRATPGSFLSSVDLQGGAGCQRCQPAADW
jgi:hypothetical protein